MAGLIGDIETYFGVNNFYDVLSVRRNATQKEIKSAFRRCMLHVHPDKVQQMDKKIEATRKCQILNSIYLCLSDPIRRRLYDADASTARASRQSKKEWNISRNNLRSKIITKLSKMSDFYPHHMQSQLINFILKAVQNIEKEHRKRINLETCLHPSTNLKEFSKELWKATAEWPTPLQKRLLHVLTQTISTFESEMSDPAELTGQLKEEWNTARNNLRSRTITKILTMSYSYPLPVQRKLINLILKAVHNIAKEHGKWIKLETFQPPSTNLKEFTLAFWEATTQCPTPLQNMLLYVLTEVISKYESVISNSAARMDISRNNLRSEIITRILNMSFYPPQMQRKIINFILKAAQNIAKEHGEQIKLETCLHPSINLIEFSLAFWKAIAQWPTTLQNNIINILTEIVS